MKKYLVAFLFLYSFLSEAATYYSQGNGNLNTLTNWRTLPLGGTQIPNAIQLTNGTNDFVIQNGHTITGNINNFTPMRLTIQSGGRLNMNAFNLTFENAFSVLTLGGILETAGNIINTPIINDLGGAGELRLGSATWTGLSGASGTFKNVHTNKVTYYGATGYTIPAISQVPSLTIEGANKILSANVTIHEDLTIATGAVFSPVANTVTIIGNMTRLGTFTQGTSTVVFADTGDVQTITGTTTFYKLQVNNAGGVVALSTSTSVTVQNALTLTSGRLQIGNNNLTYTGIAGNITSTSTSWVETNGTGVLSTTATGAFTYPVGDATNAQKFQLTNQPGATTSVRFGAPSAMPTISTGSWYVTQSGGTASISGVALKNPMGSHQTTSRIAYKLTSPSLFWNPLTTTYTSPDYSTSTSIPIEAGGTEIALYTCATPTMSGTTAIAIGSTATFTGGGTPHPIDSWKSSNMAVATVNATGVVTGVSAGTSVITYMDYWGCTNSMTVTVAPPTQPVGNRGMYFDGVDDYVSASTGASSTINTAATNNSFSLSAWVKLGKVTGNQTIISSWVEGNNASNFIFSIRGGSPCLKEKNGTNHTSSAILELNKWTHVAVSYDKTNITWYVNGVSVGLTSAANQFANAGQPIVIGHSPSTTAFFKGQLDEVKVFNKALTQAEIAAEMASTALAASCVGYWGFEDDATAGVQTSALESKSSTSSPLAASPASPLWALRVTNNQDDGLQGSLRWAVTQANTDTDQDYIDFSFPTSGEPPYTIGLSTDLPDFSNPAIVDGYSQYGAKANTLAVGNDADLRIVIDGNNTVSNALSVTAGNTIIKGLVINNATSNQLKLGGVSTSILGNFIGTDYTGTFSGTTSNSANGIWVTGADALLIGTVANADRNVISGNGGMGITVTSGTAVGPKIYNNYIGTSKDGITPLNAQEIGVDISGTAFNVNLGGTVANTGNVIGGNTKYGVYLSGASYRNVIWNNKIGQGADGIANVGNGIGIYANTTGTSSTNNIGSDGAANIITNNTTDGVVVDEGARNILIQTNKIYCNGAGAGISLKAGANNSQAVPDILVATPTTISGTAPANSTVDIYRNTTSCTATQGETWLTAVTADAGGAWSYTGTFTTGEKISATSTNLATGTSEFSVVGVAAACNPLVVTSTSDANTCGTLRNAIIEANLKTGKDTIRFKITGAGPHTIDLQAQLPDLTDDAGVLIDGFSQPGSSANTRAVFDATSTTPMNAVYGIVLGNGANIPVGLNITSNNNTIQGLVLQDFGDGTVSNNDIAMNISGNFNEVLGCMIGLGTDGATKGTKTAVGIQIGGAGNIIGDGTAAGANVVSGLNYNANAYTGRGIDITSTSNGNIVQGNIVGLAKDGSTVVTGSTQRMAVSIASSSGNTIGGTVAGTGNVLSGNSFYCVSIDGTAAINNLVAGNIIGLKANGAEIVGSQPIGINLTNGCNNNTIGGNVAAARNIISGNTTNGIQIQGTGTSSNFIKGNYIGLDKTGTTFITGSSQDYGVYLTNAVSGNTIGGDATAGEGNLISGNTNSGVYSSSSAGNTIMGNIIGLQENGTSYVASNPQTYGINLGAGATSNNIVGGSTAGARNIISGNLDYGLYLQLASSANTIKGNYIGTDKTGTSFVTGSAQNHGMYIISTLGGNIIGGNATLGEGNVISGNTERGIFISESPANSITGNIIGPQADGKTAIAGSNQSDGVYLQYKTKGLLIGGVATGMGNIIAFNTTNGIYASGAESINNKFSGNPIYSNASKAINLNYGATQANTGKLAPFISSANTTTVTGMALASDVIEIFKNTTGSCNDASTYLTTVTADASGNWTASPTGLAVGDYVLATATDGSNNTSEFSTCSAVLAAPTITTSPFSPSPVCALSIFDLGFTTTGTFNTGNVFTVQLSDNNGDFAGATTLASMAATTASPFTIKAPPLSGGGYAIRVVSSNPSVIGSARPIGFAVPFGCNAGVDVSTCTGTSVTLGRLPADGGAVGGGFPPYSVTWSPATNLSSASVENPDFSSATPGTYTYALWATDANGCKNTDTVVVTNNITPIVTMPSSQNACADVVLVDVSAGATAVNSDNFIWSTTGFGIFVPNNFSLTGVNYQPTVTDIANGGVSISLVGISSLGCMSPTATKTLSFLSAPIITGSTTVVVGATSQLSPSFGGVWVSANPLIATVNNSTGLVTGVAAGTSVITYTDAYGCTATTTVTVITPVTQPVGNRGMYFDGVDDQVKNTVINLNDFTVEFWLKTKQTGGQTNYWQNGFGLVDAEDQNNPNDFGVSLGNGKIVAGIGDGNPTPEDFAFASNTSVNDGAWHHVAVTRQGNAMQIYIDGVLDKSGSATSVTVPVGNVPLTFGSLQTNLNYFNGQLDEIKIFEAVRTADEIKADMASTATNETNLRAYWSFEDDANPGDQTIAKDVTGFAHDGTVSGSLWTLRVTNNGDNGAVPGSLRWAVNEANTDTDKDYIDFSIGDGTKTIQPTSTYTLANPVVIDGYTQYNSTAGENSSPNTNAFGLPINAKLNVVINGASAASNSGFRFRSSNNIIKGVVVNGFSGAAFDWYLTSGTFTTNKISGNFIGTNRNGTSAVGNGYAFIVGGVTSSTLRYDTIGGSLNEERNLISGNANVAYFNAWQNGTFKGNYIGTNAAGTAAIANNEGITMSWSGANGHSFIQNVMSGLSGASSSFLNVSYSTQNTVVKQNRIGTTADGTGGIPNANIGILISDDGTYPNGPATIGDNGGGGNTIANCKIGININGNGSDKIKISGNNIYGNTTSGISLTNNGNNLKAIPVIVSATSSSISGTCAAGDEVELFNDSPQSGTTNQGRIFLGTATTTGTTWTYNGTFTAGDRITATATDATNGTSEFSAAMVVANPIAGAALDFDGVDDGLSSSNSVDLSNKSFTIEFWAKRASSSSDDFVASGGTVALNQAFFVGFSPTEGAKMAFIGLNDVVYNGAAVSEIGKWHHWAFRNNSASKHQSILLDGVEVADSITDSDLLGFGPLTIGRIGWDATTYFHGQLDEVRVWSRFLCEAEIKNNMNCDNLTNKAGLELQYSFNQGVASGNNSGVISAIDSSGAGNNGTLFGFDLNGSTSNWVDGSPIKSDSVCTPVSIPAGTTWTWTGTASRDWFSPCNWDMQSVPDGNSSVEIPFVTNQPQIIGAKAKCKQLKIDTANGAMLELKKDLGGGT